MFSESRLYNKYYSNFARVSTALGLIVLAACGSSKGEGSIPYEVRHASWQTFDVTILEGAHVRQEPMTGAPPQRTNHYTAPEDLELEGVRGKIVQGDSNGEWVGIPIDNLPEAAQEALEGDRDGVVWVAKKGNVNSVDAPE